MPFLDPSLEFIPGISPLVLPEPDQSNSYNYTALSGPNPNPKYNSVPALLAQAQRQKYFEYHPGILP